MMDRFSRGNHSMQRSFRHNPQALMKRKYFYAGQFIALSLANGGSGFPCLSETVYSYLCHGLDLKVYPTVDDLPDTDMKEQLEKVSNICMHIIIPSHTELGVSCWLRACILLYRCFIMWVLTNNQDSTHQILLVPWCTLRNRYYKVM